MSSTSMSPASPPPITSLSSLGLKRFSHDKGMTCSGNSRNGPTISRQHQDSSTAVLALRCKTKAKPSKFSSRPHNTCRVFIHLELDIGLSSKAASGELTRRLPQKAPK
eukprot:scaffold358009_cov20-Prasinocladus_malaysianus.AAC.1